jgi:tungstate transport system substrate-binding protein
VLAATTSIEDTGLLDVITSEFAKVHPEIELAPIAVGTGQAIELGKHGDADVLITHDSAAEMKLIADGAAAERRSLMYNDFVVAGPEADPAHARGNNAAQSFRAVAASRQTFVSRGDDSGTHHKELAVWKNAGIDPHGKSWYIEAGVGQGDALLMASQKHAYILTDRATYLAFKSRLDLTVLCEGDPFLLNKYAVTVMNGSRRKSAEEFANWLTSAEAQHMIGEFGRAQYGASLFNPSAQETSATP